MTELQESRLKWIDSEKRCLELRRENARLTTAVYDLRAKLMTETAQRGIAEMNVAMFAPFAFGVRKAIKP